MTTTVLHGDCIEVMRGLADGSVDSVVTDPPAGISFMGKAWDGDKGGRNQWVAWMQSVAVEALRVAKPGAHALVWALPRTSHWTATAWENAGWEVRDRVSHMFGSGFPKSMSVDKAIDKAAGAEREVVGDNPCRKGRKPEGWSEGWDRPWQSDPDSAAHKITAPATPEAAQWAGWGTALKPAMEDWWLLRKPLGEKTVAANVLRWGTGALNIDGCRIECGAKEDLNGGRHRGSTKGTDGNAYGSGINRKSAEPYVQPTGRWPANVIHDGSDEVLEAFAAFGERKNGGQNATSPQDINNAIYGGGRKIGAPTNFAGDSGTAARFFYSAKANAKDRAGSKHPTVKPLSLMRYLCKLVTPPGGTVLDMFAGSGTTLQAAIEEGFHAIGIEREAEYHADILRRLELARQAMAKPAPKPKAIRIAKPKPKKAPQTDHPTLFDLMMCESA